MKVLMLLQFQERERTKKKSKVNFSIFEYLLL
jgi:hypothetical protein